MCFHLRNSIQNLIYNILKYSIMGNVVMLGFSLMIVKSSMRYEGYENHMCKICIFFVSKHGAYPATWLVTCEYTPVRGKQAPDGRS